VPLKLPKDLSL